LKNIFLVIILATKILMAEKYAIIYAELPEVTQIKTNSDRFDPQLMENAWKAVFLKWEELVCKEGIKMKNIQILYCEGIDYTHYIYAISLSRRFKPECVSGMINQSIVTSSATNSELERAIKEIKKEMKQDDNLILFEYNQSSNKIVEKEEKITDYNQL
jgi:hypothetical protein